MVFVGGIVLVRLELFRGQLSDGDQPGARQFSGGGQRVVYGKFPESLARADCVCRRVLLCSTADGAAFIQPGTGDLRVLDAAGFWKFRGAGFVGGEPGAALDWERGDGSDGWVV